MNLGARYSIPGSSSLVPYPKAMFTGLGAVIDLDDDNLTMQGEPLRSAAASSTWCRPSLPWEAACATRWASPQISSTLTGVTAGRTLFCEVGGQSTRIVLTHFVVTNGGVIEAGGASFSIRSADLINTSTVTSNNMAGNACFILSSSTVIIVMDGHVNGVKQ